MPRSLTQERIWWPKRLYAILKYGSLYMFGKKVGLVTNIYLYQDLQTLITEQPSPADIAVALERCLTCAVDTFRIKDAAAAIRALPARMTSVQNEANEGIMKNMLGLMMSLQYVYYIPFPFPIYEILMNLFFFQTLEINARKYTFHKCSQNWLLSSLVQVGNTI